MRTARSIWRRIPRWAAPGLALMASLMALLALALGGCATQAATPSGSPSVTASSTVLATATTAAPTPTATFVVLPDAASSYGPVCLASQLTLSFAIDFSSSNEMGTVTNRSTSACSLFGFPGAELLDAQRQPMQTRVSLATSGVWGGVFAEQKLQVTPGASVYFAVAWSKTPASAQSSCAAASYLALIPQGDTKPVTAPDPIQPCDGAITLSPFQPAPFMSS